MRQVGASDWSARVSEERRAVTRTASWRATPHVRPLVHSNGVAGVTFRHFTEPVQGGPRRGRCRVR